MLRRGDADPGGLRREDADPGVQGPAFDVVCISHIWWDFVWQRPQHVISRLAERHRVLWVDEPMVEVGPEREAFETADWSENLRLARLVLSSDRETFQRRLDETRDRSGGHPFDVAANVERASLMFESRYQERLEREVAEHVASWQRNPLVLWLYTPMVVKFIELLRPELVVFDVMDDLASFRFAPTRLVTQERNLVARADLLFAGGPTLFEERRARHPDAHLFPSGVDRGHFAAALDDELPIPEPMRALPRPVIGFFGVIDERTDFGMLREIASARPEWSFVMVGPLLKVREDRLPRLANLHFLGKREYRDLPAHLKAFDVAMMPFAINDATRSISPTKTLEYMAAHRPVVSTPVPDVISLYGSVVRVAGTATEFVAQIEAALGESPADRRERQAREDALLEAYSWERIVQEMDALVRERLAARLSGRGLARPKSTG